MDAPASDWAQRAALAVRQRFARAEAWWRPWNRGRFATMRPSFRSWRLPVGFEVRIVTAEGTPRRVAVSPGGARPLMLLPGLYAELNEQLFSQLAELGAARGFRVAFLEDRLAPGSLVLRGGSVACLEVVTAELVAVAREVFGADVPDVLALSSGVPPALAAPRGTFRRITGWSGAVDPAATAKRVRRDPVASWHFGQAHRRAFSDARCAAPPLHTVWQLLAQKEPWNTGTPAVLVHDRHDPVTPASALPGFIVEPQQAACILGAGGHLAFGSVAGLDAYFLPFELEG